MHLLIFSPVEDDTNINGISLYNQFIVQDVFHDMTRIKLPEIDSRITEPDICVIIFVWILKISFSLDIPALCFADQKGILQVFQVT